MVVISKIPFTMGRIKEGQISDIPPAMTNDIGIKTYDIDVDTHKTLLR